MTDDYSIMDSTPEEEAGGMALAAAEFASRAPAWASSPREPAAPVRTTPLQPAGFRLDVVDQADKVVTSFFVEGAKGIDADDFSEAVTFSRARYLAGSPCCVRWTLTPGPGTGYWGPNGLTNRRYWWRPEVQKLIKVPAVRLEPVARPAPAQRGERGYAHSVYITNTDMEFFIRLGDGAGFSAGVKEAARVLRTAHKEADLSDLGIE